MKKALLLLAATLALSGSPARAQVGKTWTTSGTEQFAQGELEGVSVLSTGEVELAPAVEKIEGLEAEFVWDLEIGADGTVYAATGAPGAVHIVAGGQVKLLHKSEEQHILSVLPLPDGSLLAGTAPEGRIIHVSRLGKVTTFSDLPDSYVWDMALGPHNEIYCATGPEGRLVEFTRAGEMTERLKVKQKNLMCVAVDKEGTVYTGTDTDGYIYSVGRHQKATVIYDAEESEVHDLVVDDEGTLYACTAQGEPVGPPGRPPQNSEGEGQGPPSEPTPIGPPSMGAPAAHNSIYRITPGEGATLLGQFDRVFVLSMALADDRILAGTGTDGRVLAVGPERDYAILIELDVAHVSAMAAAPEAGVIIGTSNAGGLWRMTMECGDQGTYISKPFDAGYLSRWGRLWWQQHVEMGQGIRIKLRTGNSGEPDQYWSEWSDWAMDPTGEEVQVPAGRFAQFGAELSTRGKLGTPLLFEVNASYRQANRQPRIHDLAADGESLLNKQNRTGRPQGAREEEPPGPGRGRQQRRPPSSLKTLAWKASDPNGDELLFELYYRGVDEAEWKELEEDLGSQTSFRWETSRVPDGHYLLRLVARDGEVRPEGEALFDDKISRPLLVDNRRPIVEVFDPRREPDGSYELTGVARDEHGRIAKMEVSRNSGDWLPAFPSDGIFDSREEPFTFHTEPLDPGEHVFVFAATDVNDNTGTGKLIVTVEAPRR